MPSSIVDVLLASEEPSVRWKVRVHALGEDPDSRALRRLQGQVRRAPRTRALLDGWAANPCGSYTKWQGGHWVLAALADLGYPAGDRALLPLRDQMLRTWLAPRYLREVVVRTRSVKVRATRTPAAVPPVHRPADLAGLVEAALPGLLALRRARGSEGTGRTRPDRRPAL